MFASLGYWLPILDGDPRGLALYMRHYSARHYRDNRRRCLFVGPGEKMVMLGSDELALWVWRKFISGDGQQGVNCAVFRNEGPYKSSELVIEAATLAWNRWPGERLYTYVNPFRVKSRNPGYCFQVAGWNRCGMTKAGLHIFEIRQEA